MSASNQRPINSLLDKTVEIDPVGIVYNITGSAVEEYIHSYLAGSCGIDGISAVRTDVVHDGSVRPEMSLYVFINTNSRDISSGLNTLPAHLAHKMEEGNFRISDNLRKALYPLCRDFKINSNPRERVIYIKCSIFKALALMFAANPNVHSIAIPEIVKLKKNDSVITVIKTNKYLDRDDSGSVDKYRSMISRNND